MAEPITLIVAIIGCVTGVLSLGINLYKLLYERPKIVLEAEWPSITGFFPNRDADFLSEKSLLIAIRINNKRVTPCSIKAVFIKHDGFVHWPLPEHSLAEMPYSDGKEVEITFQIRQKALPLPATIPPMGSIEASFYFPLADELFKEFQANGQKLTLTVSFVLTTKKITIDVPVNELNYQHALGHAPHLQERLKQKKNYNCC